MTQKFIYSVHILLEQEAVDGWRSYMLEKHIPDVLATGAFEKAEFRRSPNLENQFLIEYTAHSQAAFEDYEKYHAAKLRKEAAEKFPVFQVQRQTFLAVETLTP